MNPLSGIHRRVQFIRQSGLSLVELMVGIAIGLMVTLAGLGTQLGVQLTSSTLGDRSRLQDRGEAVLRNIGAQVEAAAALALAQDAPTDSRVRLSNSNVGLNVALTGGLAGLHVFGDEGGGNPDTVLLSLQNDSAANAGQVLDCEGNAGPAVGIVVTSAYALSSDGVLRCTGSNAGSGTIALAEGVEDLQVLYAVKAGNWAARTVRWMNAAAVGAAGAWPQIQAVQVCIQLAGELRGNPTAGDSRTNCRGAALPDDGRLRQVMTRIFVIRNMVLERE